MSQTGTKDRILRVLRDSKEPAMSASMIADEIDMSVKTVNNHVDELTAEERIETSKIGNATAYYPVSSDVYSESRGKKTCKRCGRIVRDGYDFAKIEFERYFEQSPDTSEATFYIFCRFCWSDFIGWIHDPGTIGEYPHVHSWSIPEAQLEDVREDDSIDTSPSREYLEDDEEELLEIVSELEEEYKKEIPEEAIKKIATDRGMSEIRFNQTIQSLCRAGYIHSTVVPGHPFGPAYIPAK